MNLPWKPPQQCTCGCEPCQCQECPPLFVDERLLDCWRQISAFKRMIEQIIAEMGVTQGEQGPAGPAGVAGAQGPAGPQGPAGLAIAYVGPTPPASASDGELWLNTTDNSLNIYENGNWVDISGGGVGPVGPMGPQGPQGIQGQQGPAGPQGNSGPAGSPGATGAPGSASTTLGDIGSYTSWFYPIPAPSLAVGQTVAGSAMEGVDPSGQWIPAGMWQVAGIIGGGPGLYLMQRIS